MDLQCRSAKKYLSLLLLFILVGAAMPLAGSGFGSRAASPTDALPATPTEPSACAATGEHVPTGYTFVGDGTHASVCALCGTTLLSACEYGETPVRTPCGDGTHTVSCLLCGGEKTEPCVLSESVILPTQETAGCTLCRCELCGFSYETQPTVAERERNESRSLCDADGDGQVTSADARAVLRAVVMLESLSSDDLPYADADRDGKLTSSDARAALRISVGLDGPADRHAYAVTVIQKPRCTEEGKLSFSCVYCGETGTLDAPADGHRYGDAARKPASCTKPGSETKRCKVCGYKLVVPIPAAGHRFGDPIVKDATCITEGSSTIICEVCGYKELTPLPAVGHQWAEDASKQNVICGVCGAGCAGWIELNGKTYYCEKGVKQKSWCEINGDRYFFDRNTGELARGVKIDGIKLGADGKAPTDSYTMEKIRTFINAKKIVARITDPSDSVSEKKKKAFDWVMGYTYVQYRLVGASMKTPGFEMLFANDIFEKNRTGCCGSTSYAFAFLAVECGCKAVYVCDDGVSTSGHAWVSMEGNNRVYDVVFAKAKGYEINYNYQTSDYRNWPPRKTYVGG